MKKAVTKVIIFAIFALALVVIPLYSIYRDVSRGIYGDCIVFAIDGFKKLQEGENDIVLKSCIDKVYIISEPTRGTRKEWLEDFKKKYGVNIHSCLQIEDPDYHSFAIIQPTGDVTVEVVIKEGSRKLQEMLLKTECVGRKYKFNIGKEIILEGGNNKYCITLEGIRDPPADPKIDKNLIVKEGECG